MKEEYYFMIEGYWFPIKYWKIYDIINSMDIGLYSADKQELIEQLIGDYLFK